MDLPAIATERRRDPELRLVVDQLLPRVESLLNPSRTWGGSMLTTLVWRVVRESYPQLDAVRVQIVVTAIQRVHRERRLRGTPALASAPTPVEHV